MTDVLNVACAEWREVADIFPAEMEVIMEMMIEAEIDICG